VGVSLTWAFRLPVTLYIHSNKHLHILRVYIAKLSKDFIYFLLCRMLAIFINYISYNTKGVVALF
jgi:hypothetical protein